MPTFTGTEFDDTITAATVTAGVAADGAARPSAGADTVQGLGGNDVLSGGGGTDSLSGGQGADTLDGGQGADTLAGNLGDDLVRGGDGDDLLTSSDGDGSDILEGGSGFDTLRFDIRNATTETTRITALGGRASIVSDTGASSSVSMAGVERLVVGTFGGPDGVNISDLAGSGVREVVVNLLDGSTDDGSTDTVRVTSLDLGQKLEVLSSGDKTTVRGLTQLVTVGRGGVGDQLVVNGAGGADTLSAVALVNPTLDVALNGGEGDDTVLWAGKGSFQFDGGGGVDEVRFDGSETGDEVGLFRTGVDGQFAVVAGSNVASGTAENLLIRTGGGNDTIAGTGSVSNVLAANVSVDGGAGDDVIAGPGGADTLDGGAGADFIDGGGGADLMRGGDGNDLLLWNPGGGSDVLEGGGGFDAHLFNGSNANEGIALAANGSRVALTRDVGTVTMDIGGVEKVQVRTLDGIDNVVIGDLTGTAVKEVVVDLTATGGGDDSAVDTVVVNATAQANRVEVTEAAGQTTVKGLATTVTVGGLSANDHLVVNGGEGEDVFAWAGKGSFQFDGGGGVDEVRFDGSETGDEVGLFRTGVDGQFAVVAGSNVASGTAENLLIRTGGGNDTIAGTGSVSNVLAANVSVDGGAGDDVIAGPGGADTLDGGAGADFIDGGGGADLMRGGDGNDLLLWNPGGGSDVLEGGGGFDAHLFNGSNANEGIALAANGSRVALTRDVGTVTMDIGGVEKVQVRTLDGIDNVVIGDLTGTAVKEVVVDLGLFTNTGDGDADVVLLNGGAAGQSVTLSGSGDTVTVAGLAETTTLLHVESFDFLIVDAGAGADTLNAGSLAASQGALRLRGGAGNDSLAGGEGLDTLLGGLGDDTLAGGGGSDLYAFNAAEAGRDVVIGFRPHDASGDGDTILLEGFTEQTLDDAILLRHIFQGADGVVVTNDAGIFITLRGVQLASLHEGDFLFG